MAKSLAEQKGLVPATLTTAFDSVGQIDIKPRSTVPYIAFAQPAAKDQFKTLMQHFPDIQDGDPILIFPDATAPIRLQPFRCSLIAAKQYYAEMIPGSNGKVKANHINDAGGYSERIFAALLLYLPDRVLAVTVLAKTTKCPAFATLAKAVEAAASPDWMKQGPAFEQAVAACAAPTARVVATITVSGKTSKNAQVYVATRAHIAPTTATEWKLLQTIDPAQMEECAKSYNRFIEEQKLVP